MSLHHPVSKSSERVAKCIGRLLYYHRDVLQHTATHCNTLQHTAHCTTLLPSGCPATHCNTLYHTATHCNTLQHTALPSGCPATHCTTLYHTATHCNTLQHTATLVDYSTTIRISPLLHTRTKNTVTMYLGLEYQINDLEKRRLTDKRDVSLRVSLRKKTCDWQKRCLFESLFEKKDV